MTTSNDKQGGDRAPRPVFEPTPARAKSNRAVRLGATVAGLLDPAARKHGFASSELLARWADIAGPEIAAITRPVKLARQGHGRPATLHLTVKLGRLLDLTYETDRLIARINDYLGGRAVGRIVCHEGELPADPPPGVETPLGPPPADIAARLERIANPELRRALATLGGYRLEPDAEITWSDARKHELPDL